MGIGGIVGGREEGEEVGRMGEVLGRWGEVVDDCVGVYC